jgi:pimeloyl-ACP methyl ester carboxylesterase
MDGTKVSLALLPCLLCDCAVWRAQREELADIADPWVADLTTQDNIGDMADAVLAAMPQRFAVAAISMGGYVAFELLRRAPERVTHLALVDTTAHPDLPEQSKRRRDLIALSQRGEFKGVTRQLLEQFIWQERLQDESLAGAVSAMTLRVGKEAFARQQTAIMARPDSRPLLESIAVPTLVLCGRQDVLTPVDRHEEMARAIPDAELVVIDNCGHLAPIERPAEVTAAMRAWLSR